MLACASGQNARTVSNPADYMYIHNNIYYTHIYRCDLLECVRGRPAGGRGQPLPGLLGPKAHRPKCHADVDGAIDLAVGERGRHRGDAAAAAAGRHADGHEMLEIYMI